MSTTAKLKRFTVKLTYSSWSNILNILALARGEKLQNLFLKLQDIDDLIKPIDIKKVRISLEFKLCDRSLNSDELSYNDFLAMLNGVAAKAFKSNGKATIYYDLYKELENFGNSSPLSEQVKINDFVVKVQVIDSR